ncbi:MAG: putative zinc-binding protein [Betaproteobacteria bacterium]
MSHQYDHLPLVYACSGCSSAGQMANYIALELDRRKAAEMSCIAGVGGDVPHLARISLSGRPILALDGCPFQCVKSCLAQCGVAPTKHIMLHKKGVKKRYHASFNQDEADCILKSIEIIARELGVIAESDQLVA